MKKFEELLLVNYCYPDCVPLRNIMRLSKKEAFALASGFAESHPGTTAFYRFADFENYYSLRKKQDEYLYSSFIELGGLPEEKHPLSFVVEGSDYLRTWFGKGIESRLRLRDILSCHISFTIGDSGAEYEKSGNVKLLTMEDIKEQLLKYGNNFDAFMETTGMHYIEAQLWSDKYITEEYLIKGQSREGETYEQI